MPPAELAGALIFTLTRVGIIAGLGVVAALGLWSTWFGLYVNSEDWT